MLRHVSHRSKGYVLSCNFIVACMIIGMPFKVQAQTVTATVVPSTFTPEPGDTIIVSIHLDLSETTELLGSFDATLSWSTDTLSFIGHLGGDTPGFTNPIVNDLEASSGRLRFANFNPQGAGGVVSLLNVKFEALKALDSSFSLNLEFSEMVAAQTFINLLPFLEIVVTEVRQFHTTLEHAQVYRLSQNYPNPFNSGTTIGFSLAKAGHVRLVIYNHLGLQLRTMVDSYLAPGTRLVHWDGKDEGGRNVSSGTYIYKLEAGGLRTMRRMSIVK